MKNEQENKATTHLEDVCIMERKRLRQMKIRDTSLTLLVHWVRKNEKWKVEVDFQYKLMRDMVSTHLKK